MTKLPESTSMRAPDMGELASPMERRASISTRTVPAASLTHSRAVSSVMRMPLITCMAAPRAFSLASIWGRLPCTSTSRIPRPWSRARSWMKLEKAASSTSSPPKASTMVLPRCAWM